MSALGQAALSLAQLSAGRISPGLTAVMGEWDINAPLPVRLALGRAAARQSLQRYVPEFLGIDAAEAEAQMRDIDAWAARNEAALSAIMASPATELPEQLQLQMGAQRAQQFFLANFAQAAAGIGPWESGAVERAAADPNEPAVTEAWARDDAQRRLAMFALIVKLDRDGTLGPIFQPPTAALGAIAPWLIVVVLVVVAAALVTGITLWRRIEVNNRLMADLCEKARQAGDTATVRKCIEAASDLQRVKGPNDAVVAAVTVVGVAAVVWAGLRYGLPLLERRSAAKGSRR